jgi:hypothetical protein
LIIDECQVHPNDVIQTAARNNKTANSHVSGETATVQGDGNITITTQRRVKAAMAVEEKDNQNKSKRQKQVLMPDSFDESDDEFVHVCFELNLQQIFFSDILFWIHFVSQIIQKSARQNDSLPQQGELSIK